MILRELYTEGDPEREPLQRLHNMLRHVLSPDLLAKYRFNVDHNNVDNLLSFPTTLLYTLIIYAIHSASDMNLGVVRELIEDFFN